MEITEVKRITELVKKVNCSGYALVTEVAKEMGVKKTALMQFIEDNPKLFRTARIESKSKVIGLALSQVYLSAKDNPETAEWLAVKADAWHKKDSRCRADILRHSRVLLHSCRMILKRKTGTTSTETQKRR